MVGIFFLLMTFIQCFMLHSLYHSLRDVTPPLIILLHHGWRFPCILPLSCLCSSVVFTPPRLWHWGTSSHTLCGFSSCTSSIWTASGSQWCSAGSVLAVFAFEIRLHLLLSIALLASVSGAIFWNEVSGAIRSVSSRDCPKYQCQFLDCPHPY